MMLDFIICIKNSSVLMTMDETSIFFCRMTRRGTLERFYQSFNLSSSDILRVEGTTFITLNSMAMENDGCSVCRDAEKKVKSISSRCHISLLDCLCLLMRNL